MQNIRPAQLISEASAAFTKALLTRDQTLDVYIHTAAGPEQIGGGTYGSQTINALSFSSDEQRFFADVITELDRRLALSIRFVGNPQLCDVAIYLDADFNVSGSNAIGVTIPNQARRRNWWELILNNKMFDGQILLLHYALIHEFAHVLGLEHPFDGSDGDLVNGISDPWRSVFPEDTVMAYRNPRVGGWPQAYTSNDWLALETIWGAETAADNLAPEPPLLELAQAAASLGATSTGITKLARPTLQGRAEAGATVQLFGSDVLTGLPLGAATADGSGWWTLTLPSPLNDGSYNLRAIARDRAGNSSEPSPPLLLTVDTTAPRLELVEPGTPAAGSSGNPWSLQLRANEAVTWSLDAGSQQGIFSLDSDGLLRLQNSHLSIDDPRRVELSVTAVDHAGNSSNLRQIVTVEPSSLDLPYRPSGSELVFSQQPMSLHAVRSLGSPDLINVDTPVPAIVQLVAAEDWQRGYLACNVGSPASRGTGQSFSLEGLGRYSTVVQGNTGANVTIVLDQKRDSALFLDDAYSSFHGSLQTDQKPDAYGLSAQARLNDIERIIMGGGGGLSIVDLTSLMHRLNAITVEGGDVGAGQCVFWGSGGNDNFEARGADSIVFGGAGANTYLLSAGRETLQYVFGGQARDRILSSASDQQGAAHRFDPALDTIELWTDPGVSAEATRPILSGQGDGSLLNWGGNQLFFEGQNLSLEMLTLVQRTITATGPIPSL